MADSLTRKDALRKAYGIATGRLREAHQAEFNTLYSEAAAELGHEWSPRLTDEQKAEQTFIDLLAQYPALRERLAEGSQEG